MAVAAAVLTAPTPAAHARPAAEGGQPVYGAGGARCTLGFNVRRNGAHYYLTAGGRARVPW